MKTNAFTVISARSITHTAISIDHMKWRFMVRCRKEKQTKTYPYSIPGCALIFQTIDRLYISHFQFPFTIKNLR
ncbi:hypothetical protein EX30DRAFT_208227 [Ascodesmis nigricans]|uniref:Uncharacterized protein n=1 Tax=Ascodesmis nigricans TaxID=341454 RepID=A0A4V3SHR1_9PEZI|nr:hypothetical protein EX30DRAFT_208227 [Ascodesmis nigricans]